MASCNPDADSWVLKWIEWWLDPEGYPDPKKKGVVRYYVVVDDSPVFADTREELEEQYPDSCTAEDPETGDIIRVPPKSFTFVGGTIFDNPILIRRNPNYLAELKSLPRVERARLLDGNWYVRPEGSGSFLREWVEEVYKMPDSIVSCRGWDKAGSIPSETYPSPDFTASVRLDKDRDGYIYIIGNYAESCKDLKSDVYGRFRKRPGDREASILDQCEVDGERTHVILAKDSGQAGQTEYLESAKKLMENGYIVKPDPVANNKSKAVKFEPFCAAAQSGLVKVVVTSFPNKATLDAFFSELEKFDGERSTATKKDDFVDATSTAYNHIVSQRSYNTPNRGQKRVATAAKKVLDYLKNN